MEVTLHWCWGLAAWGKVTGWCRCCWLEVPAMVLEVDCSLAQRRVKVRGWCRQGMQLLSRWPGPSLMARMVPPASACSSSPHRAHGPVEYRCR
jgi:hypothetical protein